MLAAQRGGVVLLAAAWCTVATVDHAGAEPLVVRGTVHDPDGRGLPGVELHLFSVTREPPSADQAPAVGSAVAFTLSDQRGHFRLAVPRPGVWMVRAEAEGGPPWETTVTPVVAPLRLPTLVLSRAVELGVRVVDAAGVPTAATIRAHRPSDIHPAGPASWHPSAISATTTASGRATLPWPAAEAIQLRAFAPARGESRPTPGTANGGEIRLLLPGDGTPTTHRLRLTSPDGTSTAGSSVWVGEGRWPAGVVDRDGRLDVAWPIGVALPVVAESADRSLAGRGEGSAEVGGTELRIRLRPVVVLAGRVTAADGGRPLAGASVFTPQGASTTTGRDGRFRLRLGSERGPLIAAAPGFEPQQRAVQVEGELPFRLEASARPTGSRPVRGRVMGPAGRPAARARVTLAPNDAPTAPHRTETSAGGRFILSGVAPGNYRLQVMVEGRSPLAVAGIEIPRGDRPFELGTIPIDGGGVLTGSVRDADGSPIGEASVRISDGDGGAVAAEVRTTADGRFSVAGLSDAEAVRLQVRSAGFAAREVVARVGEAVEVVLLEAARIHGRVVAADDGEPLGGASVEASWGRGPIRRVLATADPGGTFAFDELPFGTFELRVLSPSGEQEPAIVEVSAGAPAADVELVLWPGIELAGRILGLDGRGIGGAEVVAEDGRLGRWVTSTRADGSFELSGVARRVTVTASHPDHRSASAIVEPEDGGTSVEIFLERGLEVAGRVTDPSGRPLPQAEILLEPDAPGWAAAGARTARSRADGTFRLSGLAPTSYTLLARWKDRAVLAEALRLDLRSGPPRDLQLTLGPAVTLRGTVLGVDPATLSQVRVSASSADGRILLGELSSDATFLVPGAAPGRWRVQANLGARLAVEEVDVVGGSPTPPLALRLRGGYTVVGQVLGGARTPVKVLCREAHSGTGATATVGSDGRFALPGLEGGRHLLVLNDAAGGELHKQHVHLPRDEPLLIDLTDR